MSITTLKDTIKAIAQSLQLSTIVPTLIFVLVNVLLVFPHLWPSVEWSLSNDMVISGIVFATISLSYVLYAFNNPLIRLTEGYIGHNLPPMTWLAEIQKQRYREIKGHTRFYEISVPSRALHELDTHFPSREDDILPTSLGNTIAAFEHYPSTRYGMDAVALWPRFIPILQENKYIEFVAQQKTVFDFLLNMMFTAFICGLEVAFVSAFSNRLGCAIVSAVASPLLVGLFYLGAMNGAVLWGSSVRVAFDLYRDELWARLRLKPVSNYRDEVRRWRQISRLIKYEEEARFFNAFVYEDEPEKVTIWTPSSLSE